MSISTLERAPEQENPSEFMYRSAERELREFDATGIVGDALDLMKEKYHPAYEDGLRIAYVAGELSQRFRMPESVRARNMVAGALHDVGKALLSDYGRELLAKPRALNQEEKEIIATHAPLGETWINSQLKAVNAQSELMDSAAFVAGNHHATAPKIVTSPEDPSNTAMFVQLLDITEAITSKSSSRDYRSARNEQEGRAHLDSRQVIEEELRHKLPSGRDSIYGIPVKALVDEAIDLLGEFHDDALPESA